MASTYSSSLKLQLMSTGENSTTWGTVTNVNLGTTLEEAISGSSTVVFANSSTTLTLTNTNSTQVARHMRLLLSGSTGGLTRTLTVPDVEKVYIISNTCADDINVKNSTGASVVVPAGKSTWVYSTGSNVVDVVTALTALEVGGSNVVTENATQTLTNKTLSAPTINNGQLGSNTRATTQVASDDTTKIATTAMVQDAIRQTGYITADQIAANAVGSSEIANNAVTSAQIANNAVGSSEIANNAVSTTEIVNNSITEPKIASNAVTSAQIANGAVTSAKMATDTNGYGTRTVSTSSPSGGSNGDIWYRYTA